MKGVTAVRTAPTTHRAPVGRSAVPLAGSGAFGT